MRRDVRETTNYTQTSPRGSTGQIYQFRYQHEWPACSRPVTQRGHALTHVQTQAKSTVTDNLRTTDSRRGTDCFCHIYSVFLTSEIRTTSILRTTDNADGPERRQLYKITSESGRKSKPWVKISTHCYSAAPRKTIKWFF